MAPFAVQQQTDSMVLRDVGRGGDACSSHGEAAGASRLAGVKLICRSRGKPGRRVCGVPTASATASQLAKSAAAFVAGLASAHPALAALAPTSSRPGDLSVGYLLTHRPDAVLAKVNKEALKFTAGAVAGALGKTATAPFDRLKLLLQVKGGLEGGKLAAAAASGSLLQAFIAIGKQEGILGYWRGNMAQVVRVLPYSAAQLYSYDVFKGLLTDKETGELPVKKKLLAGALAGMVSTLATYPLDTLRLRMAVDPSATSFASACRCIVRDGGLPAFYRGVGPAVLGIAPYMAIELGVFDSLPQQVPSFARGFMAALLATSVCYPLDTIRRQMQMAKEGVGVLAVLSAALSSEGVRGLYRGFVPNAIKNLPNKGIRLGVYDGVKTAVALSETAYEDELRKVESAAKAGVPGKARGSPEMPAAKPRGAAGMRVQPDRLT